MKKKNHSINNISSPSPSTRRPRMIVILNELLIHVVSYRHLKFELDLDSITFQLKRGLHFSSGVEVFYVCSLKTKKETEIEPSHQEVVAHVLSRLLFEQFRCPNFFVFRYSQPLQWFLQALPLAFFTSFDSSLKGSKYTF